MGIVISPHKFLDLCPHLAVYLRVTGNQVDHHLEVVRSGICASKEKSVEFFQYLFLTVVVRFIRLVHHHSFNDV